MQKPNIELIYQDLSHANKLYEILSNPNFNYLSVKPKSLQEEVDFLRETERKRIENIEHNFTILSD
jgi:hypothetical protein